MTWRQRLGEMVLGRRDAVRYQIQPNQTLAQRLAERAYRLLFCRDVDFVEVASGLLMLGWGLQLLMPWETFDTGAGYAVLDQLAPEYLWGAVLGWIGFTQVGAYFLDHWRVRLAAALGACMIWAFLSVAFGVGNPYGTGIVVYPFLAAMSALVFWRILGRGPRGE